MRTSPSIVPADADRDVYLVLDDFGGGLGRVWRETDEASTDRATATADVPSHASGAAMGPGCVKIPQLGALRRISRPPSF
jgi:hypothetical protein